MPQPLRGFAMTILQRSYSSGLDIAVLLKNTQNIAIFEPCNNAAQATV
ncbi:hypothetical protein [Rickettsia endosymbiont of Aspidapion aeneum]